ncbi:putative C6 finger domain protein [Phaeosphaeriaceae sp. PMI808]|nr:putative C6 finger domain protein [Phaeosphaeriaceae sp. PMI808]
MLRRSHKKSRGGCLECKRRHVKCDQTRPKCRLCLMSSQDCNYAFLHKPDEIANSVTPSQEHLYGPIKNYGPKVAPPTLASTTESLDQPSICVPSIIDFDHMELLIHVTQDSDMFNLAAGVSSNHSSGLALGLKQALKAPYLMHELLAFSAQHLAFLQPKRSAHYLRLAVSLQTRALSLFNASWTEVNQSNCVAVLLFSSFLAHHVLADTLSKRSSTGLDGFLEYYIQCIEMSQGIYIIAKTAWPLLMASELEPTISMSASFTSREPINNDCQHLHDLVDSTFGLTDEEKNAYRLAIRYLQIGFDATWAREESASDRIQMIYSWPILVPPKMTSLLAKKRPEALIILAHYALLLHHWSTLWQIGDAGAYMFTLISGYLGHEWHHWMQYPRMIIENNSSLI